MIKIKISRINALFVDYQEQLSTENQTVDLDSCGTLKWTIICGIMFSL